MVHFETSYFILIFCKPRVVTFLLNILTNIFQIPIYITATSNKILFCIFLKFPQNLSRIWKFQELFQETSVLSTSLISNNGSFYKVSPDSRVNWTGHSGTYIWFITRRKQTDWANWKRVWIAAVHSSKRRYVQVFYWL